jgi:hypothetical protein
MTARAWRAAGRTASDKTGKMEQTKTEIEMAFMSFRDPSSPPAKRMDDTGMNGLPR